MLQSTYETTGADPNIVYEALQILTAAGRNFFLLDNALFMQGIDKMARLSERGSQV